MATTESPKGLLLVKIAAVAFAISACGYIVITGHESANPPAETPAPTDTAPQEGAPAAPSDASAAPTKKLDPAFFFSSKSMPISAPVIKDEADLEAERKKRAAIERALLPSSKSLLLPKPASKPKPAEPAPKAAK